MRNLTEENTTGVVLDAWSKNPDPRFKEIMDSMIRHLHAFVREVQLTEKEWEAGIAYLHECARISSAERSEFILTSDVLGVSSLVDTLNNRRPEGATENSVLGPFYIERAGELGEVPEVTVGGDLIGERNKDGDPAYVRGVVRRLGGAPVAAPCSISGRTVQRAIRCAGTRKRIQSALPDGHGGRRPVFLHHDQAASLYDTARRSRRGDDGAGETQCMAPPPISMFA